MSYGDKALKNPGSQGRTPSGKSSWSEFTNEVRGNIRNALQSMSLSEYLDLMIEVAGEDYGFYTPSWMLETELEDKEAVKKLDEELAKRQRKIIEVRRELARSNFYPTKGEPRSSHPIKGDFDE